MRRIKNPRFGIALTVLLLMLLSGLTLSASTSECDPTEPGNPCSESANFHLSASTISPMAGFSASGAGSADFPQIPVDGALTFADLKTIESEARGYLEKHKAFRQSISPHQEKPDFDLLVAKFDYNQGFQRKTSGGFILGLLINQADSELRRARDFYAYLSVHAAESAFRNDPAYSSLCNGSVDWCDFPARLRETVRETAYIHMIFGQQFTVDALGLHFDAGEIIGGEAFVRDEVDKLERAARQYLIAEDAVMEGFLRDIGNGCFISDFYTAEEWALFSRAVDGLQRARHHIAVRRSYLDSSNPYDSEGMYRTAAISQYIDLIGTAARTATTTSNPRCANGARPDNDLLAEMVANLASSSQNARTQQEGRNVFGFDVHFTPARPYRTAPGSVDTGLWDEALTAAQLAKTWQSDEEQASRQFDHNQFQLQQAILDIGGRYDDRLRAVTGCSRNSFPDDAAFFNCVDTAADILRSCSVKEPDQAVYDACVAQVPNGLLRQSRDGLRAAWLRTKRVQQAVEALPQRVEIEVNRNATVNHEIWTAFEDMVVLDFVEGYISSIVTENPLAMVSSLFGAGRSLRNAIKEMTINDANSEAVVENLLLDLAELTIDLEVAVQEYWAQDTSFETLAGEAVDVAVQARRARRFVQESPANDPSYRLVRDSARLRLASQLEYASRISYLAAKRAEYEYASRLSASNFRISDIYRARTADDILRYLTDLRAITDNLIIRDSEIQQENFNLSVALHLLGLTDENLGLTGNAARLERQRLFREWVSENTVTGADGLPVLRFTFTTSIADDGIFSNVILQGFDRFWLHQLSGIGQPKAANTGFGLNIISSQPADLRYRRVAVTQGGLVHLRARSGCILDYRLMHPAALLGYEWPTNQPPESVTTDFKASINESGGESSPAFLGRPVSATEWQVEVFAGAPELGLDDMDLQLLEDIEFQFSTTRASRTPGEPPLVQCVREDF